MSSRTPRPLQDCYLDQLCGDQTGVTLHLVNGEILTGTVIAFDGHALCLSTGSIIELVYKTAVTSVIGPRSRRRMCNDLGGI